MGCVLATMTRNRSCVLESPSMTYLAFVRTSLQPKFSVSWVLVKDDGLSIKTNDSCNDQNISINSPEVNVHVENICLQKNNKI